MKTIDVVAEGPGGTAVARGLVPGGWQYRVVRLTEVAWARMEDVELQAVLDAEGRNGWRLAGPRAWWDDGIRQHGEHGAGLPTSGRGRARRRAGHLSVDASEPDTVVG